MAMPEANPLHARSTRAILVPSGDHETWSLFGPMGGGDDVTCCGVPLPEVESVNTSPAVVSKYATWAPFGLTSGSDAVVRVAESGV